MNISTCKVAKLMKHRMLLKNGLGLKIFCLFVIFACFSIVNYMASINIRPVNEHDAPIIARCVLAAMEIFDIDAIVPDKMMPMVKNIELAATDDKRLYSCTNSIIAEADGVPVGCIISYDGSNYAALRKRTFDILYEESGLDLRDNPMETSSGEYYLDCMAIRHKYRGRGIGHLLMKAAIEQGKALGIKRFTLLVEKSHKSLGDYYARLGFAPKEEIYAFGTDYVKMEYLSE